MGAIIIVFIDPLNFLYYFSSPARHQLNSLFYFIIFRENRIYFVLCIHMLDVLYRFIIYFISIVLINPPCFTILLCKTKWKPFGIVY